jgi:murein DD-endopeptidase MepM/ murein hydrolase activator NlpD
VATIVLGALVGCALLAACGPTAASTKATWSAPTSASAQASSPVPAEPPPSAPVAGSTSASPPTSPSVTGSNVRYVFPIAGKTSYAHTHHDYPASDMMAACGLPVRAVTSGVVLEVSRVDRFDKANPLGAVKGGLFVSLLGDDGVRYYGAHLSAVQAGIEAGVRVAAGAPLGQVGSTGNSGACHLHFAISPPCAKTGDWWVRRGVLYPWSYLDSWRSGGAKSPVAEVSAWQKQHGCPSAPPAGEK